MTDTPDFRAVDHWLLACVRAIAQQSEFEPYQAQMRSLIELFAPEWIATGTAPEAVQPLLMVLARGAWASCPNPQLAFAPGRLPQTQRNDPCHCGSLRKYKHCCQDAERAVPIGEINLLPMLVEALPRKRWSELVGSRVPLPMLIDLCMNWGREQRAKDLVALLEPWFKGEAYFAEPHEPLLDCLLDCYDALGNPRKKQALLERGLKQGDRGIVASLLQRLAAIAHDRGEIVQAWEYFRQAQRMQPEAPALCHLELLLLIGEGQEQRARERARFWVQSLQRRRDPELTGLIELAQAVARDGGAAFADLALRHEPHFAAIESALAQAPAVQACYTLPKRSKDSAGPLVLTPELSAALAAWVEQLDGARDQEREPDWAALLAEQPLLWQSFELIAELVGMTENAALPGLRERLTLPLLTRAMNLLHANLKAAGAERLKLEWGWRENRCALTLLEDLAMLWLERDPRSEVAREVLTWLVHGLNPDDNQGLRMPLMALLLAREEFADAVELAKRYPDDRAEMQYHGALALHLSGKAEQAKRALTKAQRRYPKLASFLLASAPKRPRLLEGAVRVGGDDEAWLFRERHLEMWQACGGIDWLKAHASTPKPRA
jgi:tetratricopeptide (TPR) repeat protein